MPLKTELELENAIIPMFASHICIKSQALITNQHYVEHYVPVVLCFSLKCQGPEWTVQLIFATFVVKWCSYHKCRICMQWLKKNPTICIMAAKYEIRIRIECYRCCSTCPTNLKIWLSGKTCYAFCSLNDFVRVHWSYWHLLLLYGPTNLERHVKEEH